MPGATSSPSTRLRRGRNPTLARGGVPVQMSSQGLSRLELAHRRHNGGHVEYHGGHAAPLHRWAIAMEAELEGLLVQQFEPGADGAVVRKELALHPLATPLQLPARSGTSLTIEKPATYSIASSGQTPRAGREMTIPSSTSPVELGQLKG